MRLSVGDAPELQAAVLAFRAADRDIRNEISRQTRAVLNPVWRGIVSANATSHMDAVVLAKGARVQAGNPPAFLAATSTRVMRGGLVPADNWQAFEFGTRKRGKFTTYKRRSAGGGVHDVTRRTANGLPRRTGTGRVAYPALAETMPRAVSLWLQVIVRAYGRAAEGDRV